MKGKKVGEILLPLRKGLQLHPSVTMDEKIINAIEMMLNNNVKDIAVVRNGRPIGMANLEDALRILGLHGSFEKQE